MKNKLTCIITDDEPFARKGLQGYVEKTAFLELIGVCEDAMQLSSLLQNNKPDLLLLDIEMPHLTGIELLRALSNPPKVIFTTAYEQYAIQGFDLDVLDYLLKPISYERFLKAAMKAADYFSSRNNTNEANNSVFVKSDGKLEKVLFNELLYVEGMENYIVLHTLTKKIITHSTLKAFAEKLPSGLFIQTHKSFLVSREHINTIDGNRLFIGNSEVPISRGLRDMVLTEILKSK